MKSTVLSFLSCLCLVGLMAVQSGAAPLVAFDFDSLAANQSTGSAPVVDPDLSSTGLSADPGANTGAGWTDAVVVIQNNLGINSLATAIAGDEYFNFTVTPGAGVTADYSDMFLQYTLGTNVTPSQTEFSLLSDLDGFTAAIDTITAPATSGAFETGTGTFDLSSLASQTGAVEFRVYYHNLGTNAATRVGIGRAFSGAPIPALTLNGTVSTIPEPTTIAMLLLGAAGTMLRRRS